MTHKHSPSPWELFAGTIINDAEGVLIGCVKEAAGALSNCDINTARANARLFAAAPELLAACEAVMKLLQNAIAADDGHSADELGQAENALSIAITKAKGA